MAQKTRAKFRVNGINLTQSSRVNPELADVEDWKERRKVAEERGIPETVPFHQPTVVMSPVTAAAGESDENRSFWEATPMGEIKLTISNPEAAETFELGQEYYVDFERAT